MKKLITFIGTILFLQTIQAQQDLFHTLYMYAPSLQNPAYAGSNECLSIAALHRNQWFNTVEGAPKSIFFNANSPLNNSGTVNMGATLSMDKLGVLTQNSVALDYAYRLKINKKLNLSFGLKPSLTIWRNNFKDLTIKDAEDEVFRENKTVCLPNIGFGTYFWSEKYFAGFAIPHIYQNELRKETVSGAEVNKIAKQYRHYAFTAGYVLNLNTIQKIRLSTQYRFNSVAKQLDITAIYYLKQDKINIGANYKTGDSFGIIAGTKMNNGLRLALAYDITTVQTKKYIKNALELMLGYDFSYEKSKVLHPRYF